MKLVRLQTVNLYIVLAHLAEGHVSLCHHLGVHPSVLRRKLSHLNLLLWIDWDIPGRDGPLVGLFQNYIRQHRNPLKMAAATKIDGSLL
jgi:hypothetical protein